MEHPAVTRLVVLDGVAEIVHQVFNIAVNRLGRVRGFAGAFGKVAENILDLRSP